MGKAYKYRGGIGIFDGEGNSIFHRDVNTLANNEIYLPTINELNDPTEGFFDDLQIKRFVDQHRRVSEQFVKAYRDIQKKSGEVGIYSLSRNVDNELLWAYYATGHTGFAIEYDTDILAKSSNYNKHIPLLHELDVAYKDSVPQLTMADLPPISDFESYLQIALASKSNSWTHEQEIRLIFECAGLFKIDYRAVTAIYFGYRMQQKEIDYIMEQLKGRRISYYKMNLMPNSYKFKPQKINDKYPNANYHNTQIKYDLEELLISACISKAEIIQFKGYFKSALDIVSKDTTISSIYLIALCYSESTPILKVFAKTGIDVAPVKTFQFSINEHKELVQLD